MVDYSVQGYELDKYPEHKILGYKLHESADGISKYPTPCPFAPYRRSRNTSLTGYNSTFRSVSGFGEEEDRRSGRAKTVFGHPDGNYWNRDQRIVSDAAKELFDFSPDLITLYFHDSEGVIRDGNTEWVKMLNRSDLYPPCRSNTLPVTSQIPTTEPSPAPVVRFEQTLTGFPKVRETAPRPVDNQKANAKKADDTKFPVVEQAPNAPYRPFEEQNRTDEYYRRYLRLSGNVAYKHPNLGYPRERQGAIGGSWRHIKEVLGYGGGQVCFVDGLVRLYDTDSKHFKSSGSASARAALATPAYAANRHNVRSYTHDIQREMEKRAYKPWGDSQCPPINETPHAQLVDRSNRYKGFYSHRDQN